MSRGPSCRLVEIKTFPGGELLCKLSPAPGTDDFGKSQVDRVLQAAGTEDALSLGQQVVVDLDSRLPFHRSSI